VPVGLSHPFPSRHGGPLSVARSSGQGWRASATEGWFLTAASTAEDLGWTLRRGYQSSGSMRVSILSASHNRRFRFARVAIHKLEPTPNATKPAIMRLSVVLMPKIHPQCAGRPARSKR
jgi:hypothetical protein